MMTENKNKKLIKDAAIILVSAGEFFGLVYAIYLSLTR